MEWLAYLATLLGLTLPLAIGFVVIGGIVVALGILGGEVYTENDQDKRLHDKELGVSHRRYHPKINQSRT